MSIPQQLQFGLQRLAGFSSNSLRVLPLNTQSFSASQQCIIRLPVNSTIDLHSLALHFNATPTLGVLPVQSSELIGRLEILVNGSSIFGQALQEYNTLSKVFHNLICGQDKIQEQAVYSTGTAPATLAGYLNGNTATTVGSTSPLIVDNWVGFLGGNYQRFIDTSVLGSVEIRLTWSPSAVITPTAAAAGGQSFTVSNVELLVETIEFADNWFQRSLQSALSSGSLLLPYKNFASFNYYIGAGSGNINTSYASESLDVLYAFLRLGDYNSATANTTLAGVQDAHYFDFRSDGATHQFRVNNAMMPTFQATTQEAYTLMKNAVNGGGYNLGYKNVIATPAVWGAGKFTFAQSLKFKDDENLSKYSSGLNTNQSQIPLSYNFSGASGSSYAPVIIAETTSYLEIGAGQNIVYHP